MQPLGVGNKGARDVFCLWRSPLEDNLRNEKTDEARVRVFIGAGGVTKGRVHWPIREAFTLT